MTKAFLTDCFPGGRSRMRDSGPATKTLVASFPGSGFVAERDGDALNVYLVSGATVSTETLGDRRRRPLQSGMSATQLQAINKASREAVK